MTRAAEQIDAVAIRRSHDLGDLAPRAALV
jgi:hypothetical protein